jgi:predicted Zn-dependent peptidase
MILPQKLASGLQIYVVPNSSPSVSVLAMVRAGSRDELADQIGGAHFLSTLSLKVRKNILRSMM